MRETLLQFLELNRLDAEILDLRRLQQEKPAALRATEEELGRTGKELEVATATARDAQKEGDEFTLEAKAKAADLERLAAQLRTVKTNREYTAISGQMKDIQTEQSQLETQALERFVRADEIGSANKGRRAEIEERRRVLGEEEEKVRREIAEAARREQELLTVREKLVGKIEMEALDKYERVLARRGDRPMIAADGGTCQACFMQLTPQEHNLVLLAEEIVQCKSCGRILYIAERLQPA